MAKGKPLCWLSTCSSLMGDADKHRDFTKHTRETVMIEFLTLIGKEKQRESSFRG